MSYTCTVEDCFAITPKNVLRRLKWVNDTKTTTTKLDIDCWLDDPSDSDILCVSVRGQEPQKLVLEWVGITFGQTAYFNCACGYRAAKLYLQPNGAQFGCRRCQNLKYRLSSLNPKSVAGRAIHKFERMNKLAYTRASMSRIFYKGKYTKRFNRFLARCSDAGLNNVVEDAKSMLEIVKTQ